MEIALHLRRPDQKAALDNFPKHLMSFYDQALLRGKESRAFDRIYVGDEFCPNRLPGLSELKRFCRFATEQNLKLTLLTPVLTDKGLEKYSPIFEYLQETAPGTEVVVNDLGVLFYLKRQYPGLRVSAGRLLNKGFKDPRLHRQDIPWESEPFLSDCTFDQAEFQEKMAELSVSRLERDVLPYGDHSVKNVSLFKTSVYFPFGYVTTGRVCWTASFRQPPGKKFMMSDTCSCPCNELSFELRNEQFFFKIIQNGNTIFYLYPFSMLKSLISQAEAENLRLVYQGFVV